MQNTPSALLAYEREHDLNLKPKQTCNMKDKNLGETYKRISEMNDISDAVTNSGMLINYLNNGPDISWFTEHQETITTKKLHIHVKMFDTHDPIDLLVDNANFPKSDIAHDEHLSNVEIAPANIWFKRH